LVVAAEDLTLPHFGWVTRGRQILEKTGGALKIAVSSAVPAQGPLGFLQDANREQNV
jgi:hypothetical protein